MRLDWHKTLPDAYKAMLGLQKIADNSKIDHKLLELVKVRASQINGCAHCLEMHTKDARAIGESELRLNMLATWREAPVYSPHEKAALAWCEELTNISHTGASDDVYKEVEELFAPEELVELTIAIVAINGWNRLAVGFRSDVGNYLSKRKQC